MPSRARPWRRPPLARFAIDVHCLKIKSRGYKIHSRALLTAQAYKRCEFELIEILEEVDRRRVFAHYGYSSLFKYTTDALKLSDEVAYIFINVARKVREVPALRDEIKSGNITVSKAKKISAVLTAENQNYWLDLAKTSSKHQLEKQIASAVAEKTVRDLLTYVNPQDEVTEKAKIIHVESDVNPCNLGLDIKSNTPQPPPKAKCRVQLQVGVSESFMLKIRQAQDVLSQKRKRNVGLEEVLAAMTAPWSKSPTYSLISNRISLQTPALVSS